jgi:hypothetical protein
MKRLAKVSAWGRGYRLGFANSLEQRLIRFRLDEALVLSTKVPGTGRII